MYTFDSTRNNFPLAMPFHSIYMPHGAHANQRVPVFTAPSSLTLIMAASSTQPEDIKANTFNNVSGDQYNMTFNFSPNTTPTSLILPSDCETQVKLGWLVTNVWAPIHDYYALPFEPEYQDSPRLAFSHIHPLSEKSTISGKLSRLFGAESGEKDLLIKAASANFRTLVNYPDAFNSLWRSSGLVNDAEIEKETKAITEAKLWIQERCPESRKLYLVVGILTAVDASVAVIDHSSASTPKASSPSPSSSVVGMSIAHTLGQAKHIETSFEVPGTSVIAIQYRKVACERKIWKRSEAQPKLAKSGPEGWQWIIRGGPIRSLDPDEEVECYMNLEMSQDVVDAVEVGMDPEGEEVDEDYEEPIQHALFDGIELVF